MLYPVTKPSRVAKVDTGRSNPASAASSQAVQGTSRPQPADASSTHEQIHAAFEYARVALASMGTTGSTSTAPSSPEGQSGGIQQAGSAYAQIEQAARQALDITA
jgi:hypothetical protein